MHLVYLETKNQLSKNFQFDEELNEFKFFQTEELDMAETKNNTMNTGATGTAASRSRENDTDIKDNLSKAVSGDKEAAKEAALQAKDKAGEVANKAYEKASDQASSKINEQKSQIARGLSNVADNLRQVDEGSNENQETTAIENMTGKYASTIAGKIEQMANYIESREAKEMLRDVEGFARRNPAVFIGGAFATGLLIARFLKTSGSGQNFSNPERGNYNRNQRSSNEKFGSKISGQQGVTGIDKSELQENDQ